MYPVHEKVKVIDGTTIYKGKRSWTAVLKVEIEGRQQIALYKWMNRGGVWKRAQKFVVNPRLWEFIKAEVDKFVEKESQTHM